MSRITVCAAALCALSTLSIGAAFGCRSGGESAAADATVDHSLPYGRTPTAVGGGPAAAPPAAGAANHALSDSPGNDEYVYSSTSAMNVLSAARCDRARTCGQDQLNCEGEAAAEHGDELARCGKGVDGSALSRCAQTITATSCGASVTLSEPCTAAVLCK